MCFMLVLWIIDMHWLKSVSFIVLFLKMVIFLGSWWRGCVCGSSKSVSLLHGECFVWQGTVTSESFKLILIESWLSGPQLGDFLTNKTFSSSTNFVTNVKDVCSLPKSQWVQIVHRRPKFTIWEINQILTVYAYWVRHDCLKCVVLCYSVGHWEFERSTRHCMEFKITKDKIVRWNKMLLFSIKLRKIFSLYCLGSLLGFCCPFGLCRHFGGFSGVCYSFL